MTTNNFFKIKAFHIRESIDLVQSRLALNSEIINTTSTDIFLSLGENQYCLIFSYGVIVFYNCEEIEIKKVFHKLNRQYSKSDYEYYTDEYGVKLADNVYDISFAYITLPEINQSVIKIAMLNLGQSLALKYYDNVSQEQLGKIRGFTAELEVHGRLKISGKNILRFVGKTLNTENKIAENLYIFDAPPDTWENEYLEKVNLSLSKHFELGSRFRSLDNTFKIIQSNLSTFMNLYHHKESSRLEWIIIILILVEVIDTMISKVL